MLNAIVDASLRYKVLVLVAFAGDRGLGIQAFRQVPVDAFPDVTPIQVNIYTSRPASPPRTSSAAHRSDRRAMAGLPGVEGALGLAVRPVLRRRLLRDNVDIYFARRLVGEKPQGGERTPARKATASRNSQAPTAGPGAGVLVHDRGRRQEARRWTCARCTTGPCG